MVIFTCNLGGEMMKKDVLVDKILEILPNFSITAIPEFQGGNISKIKYYVN